MRTTSWRRWTIIVALLAFLHTPLAASQGNGQPENQFRVQPYRPSDYWVPSPDIVAYYVLELELRQGQALSAGFVQALRSGFQINGLYGAYGDTALNSTDGGLVFTTSMKVGSQTYQVVVDTGSSDTWLARKGFQCTYPGTGDFRPEAGCRFGPLYTPASTFKAIPNLNFHVDYSDGESLTGTFGTETVTVAGITVPNQQIATVSTAGWNGDGITSGLLGLAFPANTRAYSGNDPRFDSSTTQKPYNPIFTNMYTKGHIPPLFSVAMDRNTGGGHLAFGGLPPVRHDYGFASSPFQILTTTTSSSGSSSASNVGAGQYTLYTITVNGFEYTNSETSHWSGAHNPYTSTSVSTTKSSSSKSTSTAKSSSTSTSTAKSSSSTSSSSQQQVQMIVDTGTTIVSIPPAAADAINGLFTPKPYYRDNSGYYIISCSAIPPTFGVKIGMQTFYVNAKDMVIKEGGNRCISGVGATLGTGGVNVLGHTFLKNVVAVFDVGASMMRFAARENY